MLHYGRGLKTNSRDNSNNSRKPAFETDLCSRLLPMFTVSFPLNPFFNSHLYSLWLCSPLRSMAQIFCSQHVLKPIFYFSTSYRDDQNLQIVKAAINTLTREHPPPHATNPPQPVSPPLINTAVLEINACHFCFRHIAHCTLSIIPDRL